MKKNNHIDHTIFTPKKLEIDNNLSGKEYFLAWVEKVIKSDYDTVIFSVGSRLHKNQQIPNFSNGSSKIAILNIDKFFEAEEIIRVSDSDNVSVNYLKCTVELADRCWFIHEEKVRELKADNIMQKEFATKIQDIIGAGKSVVLLSHISPTAPRCFFEEILKDEQIIKYYGNKFLFIHSYFEDQPSIICSKEFINEMMSDDLGAYVIPDDHVVDPKWEKETLKDAAIGERMIGIYDNSSNLFNNSTSTDLFEGKIYRTLSDISFEDIRDLLGSSNECGLDSVDLY